MQPDDTRERATGSTVPLQTLLGTVVGGTSLYHKAARRPWLGRPPSLFGTVAYRGRLGVAGCVRVPSPYTWSLTRASGLNQLINKGRGLFANTVVSEACLWAVCKQCGLMCGYCGSDVPHVCSECELTSAFVWGPASG
jgi:hypothetical protein